MNPMQPYQQPPRPETPPLETNGITAVPPTSPTSPTPSAINPVGPAVTSMPPAPTTPVYSAAPTAEAPTPTSVPAPVSAALPVPGSDATSPSQPQEVEVEEDSSLPIQPVSWMAHEYLHFEKNTLWYAIFVIVVLGFIALDIFLLKSYTFSAVVLVMAIAVVVFAHRPPRVITYTLDNQALYVERQPHSLATFRAFGVVEDTGHQSIMLIPRKRFSPGLTVYFPEESGEQIVDILGHVLPMEEHHLDAVDRLVRLLRL